MDPTIENAIDSMVAIYHLTRNESFVISALYKAIENTIDNLTERQKGIIFGVVKTGLLAGVKIGQESITEAVKEKEHNTIQ